MQLQHNSILSPSLCRSFKAVNIKVLSPDRHSPNQQQGKWLHNQIEDRCLDAAEQRHPSVQPDQTVTSLQLVQICVCLEQLFASGLTLSLSSSHTNSITQQSRQEMYGSVVLMNRCSRVRGLTQLSSGCLTYHIIPPVPLICFSILIPVIITVQNIK